MSTRESREKAVFCQALEISDPTQRWQFLEQACGVDPALRDQVEKLLALSQVAGDFFRECAPALEPEPADTAHALSSDELTMLPELPESKRIGPYKLLQKLGEGGYGVVYMAEQEQPIRRRVALKIIKLGMDTKSVIARFEAERQALALMDHPNIARVLDAGATETGRPYFVMELVKGGAGSQSDRLWDSQGHRATADRQNAVHLVCATDGDSCLHESRANGVERLEPGHAQRHLLPWGIALRTPDGSHSL